MTELLVNDYNLIEPHIYLGCEDAASYIPNLTKLRITHILTLSDRPMSSEIADLPHLTLKFINVQDQPREDLLSHFEETYEFIQQAVENGNIMIHCYVGMSRSAAIVIAYFMKKYNMGFSDALERVKSKRKYVNPNTGFVEQLKLYGEMGCQMDPANINYKFYMLNMAANHFKITGEFNPKYLHVIKADPALNDAPPNTHVFQCGECDRALALTSHLLLRHTDSEKCLRVYFIEPITWMNVTESLEGELKCPTCETELGLYSWGTFQCLCGLQVTPSFHLDYSKVRFVEDAEGIIF